MIKKKSNTTLGPKFYCRSKSAVTRRSEVVQQNPPGDPNLSASCVDLAMPQGCRSNFENRKNLALHPGKRPKNTLFPKMIDICRRRPMLRRSLYKYIYIYIYIIYIYIYIYIYIIYILLQDFKYDIGAKIRLSQ